MFGQRKTSYHPGPSNRKSSGSCCTIRRLVFASWACILLLLIYTATTHLKVKDQEPFDGLNRSKLNKDKKEDRKIDLIGGSQQNPSQTSQVGQSNGVAPSFEATIKTPGLGHIDSSGKRIFIDNIHTEPLFLKRPVSLRGSTSDKDNLVNAVDTNHEFTHTVTLPPLTSSINTILKSTISPTDVPTETPTEIPSAAPSEAPSAVPTDSPTFPPTSSPSEAIHPVSSNLEALYNGSVPSSELLSSNSSLISSSEIANASTSLVKRQEDDDVKIDLAEGLSKNATIQSIIALSNSSDGHQFSHGYPRLNSFFSYFNGLDSLVGSHSNETVQDHDPIPSITTSNQNLTSASGVFESLFRNRATNETITQSMAAMSNDTNNLESDTSVSQSLSLSHILSNSIPASSSMVNDSSGISGRNGSIETSIGIDHAHLKNISNVANISWHVFDHLFYQIKGESDHETPQMPHISIEEAANVPTPTTSAPSSPFPSDSNSSNASFLVNLSSNVSYESNVLYNQSLNVSESKEYGLPSNRTWHALPGLASYPNISSRMNITHLESVYHSSSSMNVSLDHVIASSWPQNPLNSSIMTRHHNQSHSFIDSNDSASYDHSDRRYHDEYRPLMPHVSLEHIQSHFDAILSSNLSHRPSFDPFQSNGSHLHGYPPHQTSQMHQIYNKSSNLSEYHPVSPSEGSRSMNDSQIKANTSMSSLQSIAHIFSDSFHSLIHYNHSSNHSLTHPSDIYRGNSSESYLNRLRRGQKAFFESFSMNSNHTMNQTEKLNISHHIQQADIQRNDILPLFLLDQIVDMRSPEIEDKDRSEAADGSRNRLNNTDISKIIVFNDTQGTGSTDRDHKMEMKDKDIIDISNTSVRSIDRLNGTNIHEIKISGILNDTTEIELNHMREMYHSFHQDTLTTIESHENITKHSNYSYSYRLNDTLGNIIDNSWHYSMDNHPLWLNQSMRVSNGSDHANGSWIHPLDGIFPFFNLSSNISLGSKYYNQSLVYGLTNHTAIHRVRSSDFLKDETSHRKRLNRRLRSREEDNRY